MTGEVEQRPWGSWHVLDEGPGYKVKRVVVAPQQRLSYQTHEQRAEHWVVVQGTAYAGLVLVLMMVGHGGQDFIYFKF